VHSRTAGRLRLGAALVALTAGLAATAPAALAVAPTETVYGVVDNAGVETLATLSTTSGTVTTVGPIVGLTATTEKIVSMDFRPATGQLYVLTSDDEVNVISNLNTTPTATPLSLTGVALTLAGAADIDFNPVPDALRIVGAAGENIPLATGVVAKDTNLSGDAAGAVGAAYTNATAGPQQTTLYDTDSAGEELVTQGGLGGVPSPNGGVTTSVGAYPITTTTLADGGLDISANSGRAIALRTVVLGGGRALTDIDLSDASTTVGVTSSDATLHAIAVQPAAAAMSFTAAAGSVGEAGATVTLTVRRVGNINATPSFNYTVAPGTATAPDFGTATPAGPIAFLAGETTKTITIPIVDDELDEPSEAFTVTLNTNTGGSFGAPTVQTVTIFDDDDAPIVPPAVGEPETAYAVDGAKNLLTFSTAAPATVTTVGAITGVDGAIAGIDIQPSTGRLFAVSATSKVYTINKTTAAATQVGTAAFTPTADGTSFGIDFNPVPNAIRFLSSGGAASQSLRLSPATGATLGTDTAPAGTTAGAAYTNSVNGANQTTLYVVDSAADTVKRIGGLGGVPSPNGGTVTSIGSLGVTTDGDVGFDISGSTNTAYASLQTVDGQATFHRIDLVTGAATAGAPIGNGSVNVVDLAIDAQPPSVQLAAAAVSVREGTATATVTVNRTGNTDGVSNVTVSTNTTGTATAGTDFTAVSAQAVAFAAGETSKAVTIAIADDASVEDSETIGVTLALAATAPGASLAAPNAATVTIFDNDPVTVTNNVPVPVPVNVEVKANQVLLISAPSSVRRAALAKGLKLTASCAETCAISYTLRLGNTRLGTAKVSRTGRGIATITLRLTKAGKAALTKAFRSRRVRSRTVRLVGTATDSDGGAPATATARITVTR